MTYGLSQSVPCLVTVTVCIYLATLIFIILIQQTICKLVSSKKNLPIKGSIQMRVTSDLSFKSFRTQITIFYFYFFTYFFASQ